MRGASAALVSAALALAACQRADEAGVPSSADPGVGAQRESTDVPPADATITGELWLLAAIRRPGAVETPVAADALYYVEFRTDGSYLVSADCNDFTGTYDQPARGALLIRTSAATLAACPQPSLADEYVRALASVTAYERSGDELRLSYNTGGELKFSRGEVTPVPQVHAEVARTFVFDCDGDVSFTVRFGPGEMALWAPASLGGGYQVLSLIQAASGARYEEGGTVFWSKGELATIELGGQRYVDCRSNPRKVPWADAARRGVTFRALGNEPSWYVEIFPDYLAIFTDLGERNGIRLAHGGAVVEGGRTTYRAMSVSGAATVVIDRRACADTMSGEGFEAAATVTFDNRTLRGCGRFL